MYISFKHGSIAYNGAFGSKALESSGYEIAVDRAANRERS